MKRGRIYLQYGFWEAVKKIDKSVFGPDAWELFEVMRASNVQAEIPLEDFGHDDFMSMLWHETGGSCYIEKGEIEKVLSENNPSIEDLCSVFLLNMDELECEKYSQRRGLLCFNADMLSHKKYLINEKNISYEFHQVGDYYCLRDFFTQPCNSLIMIDPHILNESSNINKHLRHLLNNILPESLDMPFDISIFSGIGKNNFDDKELVQSFYTKIQEMLQKIRPNLIFSFSLYQIPAQGEGWHDRYVLTNTLMIEATGGFDVFGRDRESGNFIARKDCKFHIYQPILNKNADDYFQWIKKTSLESKKEERYQHRRFGTENNRLFQLEQ